MSDKRYLPILTPDGEWIENKELMLLAVMSYPEQPDERDRLFQILASSPEGAKTGVDLDILNRQVMRMGSDRERAGVLLWVLARGGATMKRGLSSNEGYRIAAKAFAERKGGTTTTESAETSIRKAFSTFRSTATFEATKIAHPELFEELHRTEVFEIVLGMARAFELFVDNNLVKTGFNWNPWRVPERVEMLPKVVLPPLDEEEKKLLNS